MARNKLKDMEITSNDLCRQGANQEAYIKLFKSEERAEGGERQMEKTESGLIEKLTRVIAKALGEDQEEAEPITKSAGMAQVEDTTQALRKSLESIIADDSLSPVEKHDMMAESLQAFTAEATDLMDGWAQAQGVAKAEDPEEDPDEEEEEDEEEPGGEPEGVEKGVFDMATIDINKMSPEDKATLEALEKKYAVQEEPGQGGGEIHPDVQKAIDEVAELRKSLELKELEGVARKYEIIGKKAEELVPKLYELKKAGEQHYNDYVALLDEQVQMAGSGIFKEIGSSRGGAGDLDGIVSELRKADPSLTREQAVMKAFETNPGLDPFTGRMK